MEALFFTISIKSFVSNRENTKHLSCTCLSLYHLPTDTTGLSSFTISLHFIDFSIANKTIEIYYKK